MTSTQGESLNQLAVFMQGYIKLTHLNKFHTLGTCGSIRISKRSCILNKNTKEASTLT